MHRRSIAFDDDGKLYVADRANPKLVTHKTWAPPFGGGTHNALPLPDRW